MANTYLTRTPSSASNRRTFTISTWVKLASLGGNTTSIFSAWYADSTVGHFVFRGSSDKFGWSQWSTDSYSTRLFRDVNGWYHVVLSVDTTQATASNRIKMYINGVQETSFSVGAVYPSQNEELPVNNNNIQTVGSNNYSSNQNFFDGSMSHFHLIDGTAYDATAFGSTDATTGEWKINTSPSVTYGTNGFFILKDGNSVTDQSGNSNNFTINVGAGGGLNKTEDCPSNVFATFNPLSTISTLTYAYGNNQITGVNSNVWKTTFSTLGMNYGSSGKYYYEIKVATLNSQAGIGVWGEPLPQTVTTNFFPNHHPFGFVYKEDGSVSDDSQTFYTGSSFTSGDIIQCALDIDNSKIYFGKNGTWQNSGDPTSGATGTGAVPLEDNGGGAYFFFGTCYGTDVEQANFGNGYFANNPVSSAGTNASGNGIFEYDVPTGYTALSTKGLNT